MNAMIAGRKMSYYVIISPYHKVIALFYIFMNPLRIQLIYETKCLRFEGMIFVRNTYYGIIFPRNISNICVIFLLVAIVSLEYLVGTGY